MKFIDRLTHYFIGDEDVTASDQVWFFGFAALLIIMLIFTIGNIIFIGGMK